MLPVPVEGSCSTEKSQHEIAAHTSKSSWQYDMLQQQTKHPRSGEMSLAHAKCALNAASSLPGRELEDAVALLLSLLKAEQKQRNDTRGSIVPSSTSKTAAGGKIAASGVISLLLLSL